MKYNLLQRADISHGPYLIGSLPPPFKVIYHILASISVMVMWKPLCNVNHCPSKGCRRMMKNHVVHSVHFMLHCLSLLISPASEHHSTSSAGSSYFPSDRYRSNDDVAAVQAFSPL